MTEHCCNSMREAISSNCSTHNHACPDAVIRYIEKFDEYGLLVNDGGSSIITIQFCPWCGKTLPESKRDLWFEKLENLGLDSPFEQNIPEAYKTNAWYKST